MSQRFQSIMFFLSAVLFAMLFFMPLSEYVGEINMLQFNAFGIESLIPNGEVPFGNMFALPVLVLSVTSLLLGLYLSFGIFRAVKLAQFQQLYRIACIDLVVVVAWIALVYAYYIMAVGKPIGATPTFKAGAFLPLASLVLVLVGSAGLRKDIKKVRATDRLR